MKSKIILLSLALLMMTGCAENSQSEISTSQAEETVTTEISTSAISIQTTETATTSTTCIQSTESDKLAERKIVEDVEKAMYGGYYEQFLVDNTVEYMMDMAEKLSERVLGEITSEEDAIEKAKAVLIELGMSDWIERTESEFVEIDGEKVKYQRRNKSYSVEFFDEYDACQVVPNPPSGITEDGRDIDTPAMPPYVIMRKSDGKVLGVFA